MRDMLWFVDPGRDELPHLVQRMRELARSVLKAIEHEFHAPPDLPSVRISLELKRSAVLIFKEALHNVLRHSTATRVDIHLFVQNGFFAFEVADNGRGFDPTAAKDGHGLNNMKHRANTVGGTLEILARPGEGTRIIFRVKLVDAS